MTYPSIACADGKIHAVFTRVDGPDSRIVYACSGDKGATWTNLRVVSSAPININPRIAAEGSRVALSWSTYSQEGFLRVVVRESTDSGVTWSNPQQFTGVFEYKGSYASDLSYRQGAIDVVWEEPVASSSFKKSTLSMVTIRDSSVVGGAAFQDARMRHTRCASTTEGTGVVYQRLNFLNMSWDIYFCLYDGTGWLAPVPISDNAEESIHPDIIADSSGFHVVWAEKQNGVFCIMRRNSADGVVWDSPGIIGEDALGAWRPQIAAGTDRLAVVWEAYETGVPVFFSTTSSDHGLNWSSPSRLVDGGFVQRPAVASDPQNLLHAVYQRGWAPALLEYTNLQL